MLTRSDAARGTDVRCLDLDFRCYSRLRGVQLGQPCVSLSALYTASFPLTRYSAYNLAIATYAIAFWHFGSEMALFRTVTINRAAAAPLVVASQSIEAEPHEHHADMSQRRV